MRRGTQAHDLRTQRHGPVVGVGRPMMQRDVDAHADLLNSALQIHLASDMPASNVLSWGMTNYFDLTGKVALVTGGSRGLGYQMVKAFAAHGADVFVTSRKLEACEKVAAEVRAMGRKAATHACNVANWQELDGLVDAAYAAFGKVDILVNNAGSSPLAPSSLETPEQLFDRIVSLNFKGPFRLMSLVGSRMAAGDGRLDHQYLERRRAPAAAADRALCRRQGRAQRHHRGLRLRVRAEGAGQHHLARPLPHRRLQGVERGAQAQLRRRRSSAAAGRRRS